jgi:hypothetical protein
MRRISFVFVLLGLVGCYASEKLGKDIRDTSHDVNQGGIYLHGGALGVYRPEPLAPQLTNASLTTAPAIVPVATVPAAPAPAPTTELPLPRKEDAPAATQWPAPPPTTTPPLPKNASDAGASEPGAFSL